MKTILITGASDGIGKSIAIKLLQQVPEPSGQELNLILFGRNQARLQKVVAACQAHGAAVTSYAFDLTDNVKRRQIVAEIISKRPVDVLINNAGIWQKVGDVTSLSEDQIQEIVGVNLTSQILLTRQLLGQMRGRAGTAIVNIVSKSGLVAQAGQSVYTASKYGMKGFTDVLREDTKTEPIRIAGVYQSGTSTSMFAKAGDDFPIEKFTDPNDLADVVVFMLTRPERIWLNEVHVAY